MARPLQGVPLMQVRGRLEPHQPFDQVLPKHRLTEGLHLDSHLVSEHFSMSTTKEI